MEQPQSKKELPKFPIHIFPTWIKEYAEQVSNALPCALDFVGVNLLGVFSTIIDNKRFVQLKGSWKESALLYIALVSKASTKKSPALKHIMSPLYKLQEKAFEEYKIEQAAYIAKSKEEQKAELPPTLKQYFVTDTTTESASYIMGKTESGFLYLKDEISAWINEMNQYKGGKGSDKQFWLSMWGMVPILVTRKFSEPVLVNRPYIPVLGAIQPDLTSTLNSKEKDGFINRILFSMPFHKKAYWTEKDMDEVIKEIYVTRCLELRDLFKNEVLQLAPEAHDLFKAYYDELVDLIDNEPNPLIESSLSKMQGYTGRFALIIQLINHPTSEQVSETSMKYAIELSNYFIAHMRKVMELVSEDKGAKEIIDIVTKIKELGGSVSPRDIYKKMKGYDKAKALEMFNVLEKGGYGEISYKTPKNGGHKRVIFTLFDC